MRIEKVAIMNEVVDRVKASDYCFIINYGGVDVTQLGKLRAALREHESRLLIVKNTFLAHAAKEKGWSEEVNAMFAGHTAIVTGKGEPTAVAKAIWPFITRVKSWRCSAVLSPIAIVRVMSVVPSRY